MRIKDYLNENKNLIDNALSDYLTQTNENLSNFSDAIKYSLLAGGKRIRPILAIAASDAVGGRKEEIVHVAASIEIIHTYSLVHDDLPSMDNDDFRRGKPTSHKVYGEGTAILVGDALLTLAFTIIADRDLNKSIEPDKLLRVIHELGVASGLMGMVGGQFIDIKTMDKDLTIKELDYMHKQKTGALITASVRIGGIIGGANGKELDHLTRYGEKIGLAFQIADDLLDAEGKPEVVGKGTGKDAVKRKVTYPGILGIRETKEIGKNLIKEAINELDIFDQKADPLREIAGYIMNREK